VSSDRLANSGLRVQASCMAMGQAAGAAATLAAKAGTTPLEVPLKEIHDLLRTTVPSSPAMSNRKRPSSAPSAAAPSRCSPR
jgi:hypothetical protein